MANTGYSTTSHLSHNATGPLVGNSACRSVELPRTALFFRLARRQDTIQADGHWSGMGGSPAVFDDACFSLFFGRLAHIPSQGLPYPIFYYGALLPWTYFATVLQGATNTIVENQRVITKVYFPRLVLPLSCVVAGLVDFAISFAMFIVLMIYYGIRPTAAILWFPVFLLLAMLTALGVGLWLSH